MKKIAAILIACVAVAGFAASAMAASPILLTLTPIGTPTINLGDTITFNLNISNLHGAVDGTPNSPALASFDLVINYDSSVLAFSSASIGSYLNVSAGDFPSTDGTTTAGKVYLDDFSFDTAAALEASQPAAFTIGTVTLRAIAEGTSAVSFDSGSSLGDENSNSLSYTTSNSSVSAVPEPGSAALIALGLGAIVLFRLRRNPKATA